MNTLLLFTTPFLVTWGAPKIPGHARLVTLFLSHPIDPERGNSGAAWFGLSVLNGAAWGIGLYGGYCLLRAGWRRVRPRLG
ncbi:hypothetical protein E5K00_01950 [Hymenobacter aquaticus]|uniref:Uncharacterized protein n=1 Tax=Hymenobacter aquaticus TaxID=1867101 RepID=A0A4Z0Q4F3_9BACT|nr:hypothetical protein [Hymenobacter aquaticus]TGE24003.1 hypothetical protein E5K00_01950 [Hymenobacter aquaticus]